VRFASLDIKEAHRIEIINRDTPIVILEFLSRSIFEICIVGFSTCIDRENHPFG